MLTRGISRATQIIFLLTVLALFTGLPLKAGPIFNITFDPSLAAFGAQEASFENAVNFVTNEYSGLFGNNVTLNITVTADPDNGLGASSFESNGTYSYDQVRAALISHASTPDSISAAASLPATDPTGGGAFVIPNAEAKALGLLAADSSSLDGTFYIGTGNTYTFDPNNRAVPGAYDFIGTAEHEFSEIMGRSSQLTNTGFGFLPFDLFRYTAPGVENLDPNATGVYFSTDGGSTVANLYNAPGNGGDIQDWDCTSGCPDSYGAFGITGEKEPITAVDVTAMNVLGWEAAQAAPVPEPASAAFTIFGLIGIIAFTKLRKIA